MTVIETLKSYLSTDPGADVRAALRADHERIRELAAQMAEEKTAGRRRALLAELKPLVTAHARAEEQVVYGAMLELRGAKEAHDLGNEGFVEHSLTDVLLERLAKTDLAGTDAWKAHATVLKEMLEHHLDEEEDAFFDALGERFDAAELEAMAIAFERTKAALDGGAEGQRRRR